MLEGPRGGRCLRAEPVPGAQTVIALAALHRLLQDCGVQPAVVQTDRDPCFVGTEGGPSRAVPGRFTLWLWGHESIDSAVCTTTTACARVGGQRRCHWKSSFCA